MDDKDYRSISFRLNLSDASERELYQKILEKAGDYASISSFSKYVFTEYFRLEGRKKEIRRIGEIVDEKTTELVAAVKDELHRQSLSLIGCLAGADNREKPFEEKAAEDALPSADEKLPAELSGILDFIN